MRNKLTLDILSPSDKVPLKLSSYAWDVLYSDMHLFYGETDGKRNEFISNIIANFYTESMANIGSKVQKLNALLEYSLPERAQDLYADSLYREIPSYEIHRKRKLNDPSKAHYDYVSLNSSTEKALDTEDRYLKKYFNNNPSHLVSCVIEEYCRLPFYMREKIFYSDICKLIESACRNRFELAVTYGNEKGISAIIQPCMLIKDSMQMYNYCICYARNPGEIRISETPVSLRLSTNTFREYRNSTSTFTLKDKELETVYKMLSSRGPAYLPGKGTDAKIKLTREGLALYDRILAQRPEGIFASDTDKADRILTFTDVPEFQLLKYFIRFEDNAEILEPLHLRQKMIDTITKMLSVYHHL